MAHQPRRERSKFVVDLGAIPVPSALGNELEGEIQKLALAILAKIDFRGDLHIGDLPPGTYGIVIDPTDGGTEGEPGEPQLESRKEVAFPCRLASSKAKGIAAIRLKSVKPDLHIAQLDKQGNAVSEFVFHPILNSAKEVQAVSIERVGSRRKGLPLSLRQRTSLKEIVGELAGISSAGSGGATAYDLKGWLGAIGAGLAVGWRALKVA